jgi:CheY-like chemotaxis protein
MVSIVVADDHKIVREGLIRLLESREDFTVVGEASNGEEAVALVMEKRPDIVLMDINMPKLSGIDATRQLGKAGCQSKILVLSMHESRNYVEEVLRIESQVSNENEQKEEYQGMRFRVLRIDVEDDVHRGHARKGEHGVDTRVPAEPLQAAKATSGRNFKGPLSVGGSSPLPGSTSDNSIYVKYGPEELSPPRRGDFKLRGGRAGWWVALSQLAFGRLAGRRAHG